MRVEIRVVGGIGQGVHKYFDTFPISIGRYPENDIILTDTVVSRQHAVLAIEGNSILVMDLGSKNGTYVNNARVIGNHPIQDNDQLMIGNTIMEIRIVL